MTYTLMNGTSHTQNANILAVMWCMFFETCQENQNTMEEVVALSLYYE